MTKRRTKNTKRSKKNKNKTRRKYKGGRTRRDLNTLLEQLDTCAPARFDKRNDCKYILDRIHDECKQTPQTEECNNLNKNSKFLEKLNLYVKKFEFNPIAYPNPITESTTDKTESTETTESNTKTDSTIEKPELTEFNQVFKIPDKPSPSSSRKKWWSFGGSKRKYKKSKKRSKRVSKSNKKRSRARGLFDYIFKKTLIQKFTDCKQETDCNSIKSKIIEQLTEMKKNEIKEIKKEIKDKYDETLKQGNALSKGIYKMEDEQLARDLKNKSSKDQVKMVEAFKKQRETNIIEDKEKAHLDKEKYEENIAAVEPNLTYYIEEQLQELCNTTNNPAKCNAQVQKYIEMDKPLKSPIFDFKGSINSASSSVFASPRSSPRSNATSPRDNLWFESAKSNIEVNPVRLSDERILLPSARVSVEEPIDTLLLPNTDTISVIILNANRIKCLLQLFKTKNYKKVTDQIYIVKLIFKEKEFYFILIDENIKPPNDRYNIIVNYLFIADTFDYAKTQQITSHFNISNGNSVIILPCAHNIGKYDGNCDAAAGKSVSNYKSKCNNWSGTDIDKKSECNIMNGSPIDWSLYKTAYNKVRTTTLLYKSKDVIKCRDTDLLTVALKYIVDSPEQITGNLQNELVDDEDLVKMRQYHNTLFKFLESFNPDILYNAPRNSREESAREESEETKSN